MHKQGWARAQAWLRQLAWSLAWQKMKPLTRSPIKKNAIVQNFGGKIKVIFCEILEFLLRITWARIIYRGQKTCHPFTKF